MNFKQAEKCKYIPVSEVRLTTGKMSSRTGENIVYSDFKKEIVNYAVGEIEKRHKLNKKETEKRALAISIGAIKFNMLKPDLNKTIIFDKKEALKFEGDTGPYIQYTHARCNSILKKAKPVAKINYDSLNELDFELVKIIGMFPSIVEKAGEEYKPSIIANYLLELSKKFNEFYSKNQVLKAENEIKKARITIVQSIKCVLKTGLYLLGIDAPNEM